MDTELNDSANCKIESEVGALFNEGDQLGPVFGRNGWQGAIIEDHRARFGGSEPGEESNQGGFARAVGSNDGRDRALGDRAGDALEDQWAFGISK